MNSNQRSIGGLTPVVTEEPLLRRRIGGPSASDGRESRLEFAGLLAFEFISSIFQTVD